MDLTAILQRLKSNTDRPAKEFNNWALIPAQSIAFSDAFYLINWNCDETEFEQSGLIETSDWDVGIAEDISGQKYVLGRVNKRYYDFLKKNGSVLIELMDEKYLPEKE